MAQYIVYASYHGTVSFETEFNVEVPTQQEALKIAEELVYKSGGENTELFQWQQGFIEGDGDYDVDVEKDEE
jgi:hypothetical protein